ncbi:hypothetical protein GWK17_01200 [Bacillus selenatarsenatis]|uniref:Uncharacterized protein n=1 Tax=Mesobacillus selenatarsenatis TaxID=388741 RepID=A0A846TNU5_9BACI|nr:hypothetical protein [Mesobacillus selenatarsenatis]
MTEDFIGDNFILLGIFYFYWRKKFFIGDFPKFIGELEKTPDFYQFNKKQEQFSS